MLLLGSDSFSCGPEAWAEVRLIGWPVELKKDRPDKAMKLSSPKFLSRWIFRYFPVGRFGMVNVEGSGWID